MRGEQLCAPQQPIELAYEAPNANRRRIKLALKLPVVLLDLSDLRLKKLDFVL